MSAGIPVIGVAGGIGSGKSVVARLLEELGCVVSDSDAQARAALDRDDVRATLISWWGNRVLGPDGSADRKVIAGIVFADEGERERLEGLIHPLVRESRSTLIERARKAGAPGVVIDAPLLFEAGLDAECDAVVFVETPRSERLKRVRERRGWDEAELGRREKAQLPLEEKRARSDYVVENRGSIEELRPRVAELLNRIRQDSSKGC